MGKKVRIAVLIVAGLLLLAAVILVALWLASRHVPQFYREALAVDAAVQQQAAEHMDRQAMQMASNVEKSGHWQMRVTAAEINGWLAVVLPKKFPDSLPATLRDPRVAIEPGRLTLACRYQQGNIRSVLTLTIEPYVPKPDVLALRIRKARAGLVPMPLGDAISNIAKAVQGRGLDVQRRQADGDPVLQITLTPQPGERGKTVRIETLQLRPGEIDIAGTTEK